MASPVKSSVMTSENLAPNQANGCQAYELLLGLKTKKSRGRTLQKIAK